MSDVILKLDGIVKKYDEFYASNNVSFDIKKGEFVTLLGPSGCGKSTLLKMIGGFTEPTEGEMTMCGETINDLSPQERNTAMCFQSYALFPHLSVSQNICFGLETKKMSKDEQVLRLEDMLYQLGLYDHKDKLPGELSGGQQQRVALARAMVMRPDLILFDEPLSNLDAKMRESVRFEIKELQRNHNLTSIYVTHDQSEALAMSDIIVVLNAGRIEQIGTPEDIYYRPINRFVADFIGAANLDIAKVSENGDGTYSVETEHMGTLTAISHRKPDSDYIHFCWRPEEAELCKEGDKNSFPVRVTATSFLGDSFNIFGYVGYSENKVRIKLSGRSRVAVGDVEYFKLPEDGIRFLEKNDA